MKLLVAQRISDEMTDLIVQKAGGTFEIEFLARAPTGRTAEAFSKVQT